MRIVLGIMFVLAAGCSVPVEEKAIAEDPAPMFELEPAPPAPVVAPVSERGACEDEHGVAMPDGTPCTSGGARGQCVRVCVARCDSRCVVLEH